MKRQIMVKVFLIALALVASLGLVVACGGSDGGGKSNTQLSGTVAAGSPVSGMVYVEGAFGNIVSAAINNDGSYSIDVSTLEAPYLVYAKGTVGGDSVKFYSSAVDAGSLNITPVTDFILRNALEGVDPATLDWTLDYALINSTVLEAAEAIVETQLGPILAAAGITNDMDLMSMSFNADHTGMDLVLDVVTISISGTSVTVTDNLTGDSFTDDLATLDPDGELTADPGETLTDAVAIQAVWSTLTAILAGSPSSATLSAWITPYVAEDFLDEGEDKAYLLATWDGVNEGPPPGLVFSTFPIANIAAPTGYTKAYTIGLSYTYEGKSESWPTTMVYNGTAWQWYGDQKVVGLNETPMSVMSVNIDTSGSFINNSSGLQFYIRDESGYALGNGINYIVVSGPGVPAVGFLMKHNLMGAYRDVNGNMVIIPQDAAAIALIPDNAEYTITLCDNAAGSIDASTDPLTDCSVVDTYTSTNAKPPVPATDPDFLDIFPTLVAPTSHDITTYDFTSGITVQWSNPADGTYVVRTSVMADGNWAGNDRIEFGPTDTSYTVDTASFTGEPYTSGNVTIEGYDIFGRKVALFFGLYTPDIPFKPGM